MSPTDPRHGTVAGYVAGCRNRCCRDAINHYEKRRKYDVDTGRARMIDATGTRRRIQALVALGWTHGQIGERCGGVCAEAVHAWRVHDKVWRVTADKVATAYEAMCMTVPPETNKSERARVARSKGMARRHGFVPPLAWDDIDNDPEPPQIERPKPPRGKASFDLAEYDRLVQFGESEEQAARRFGVTTSAIEMARARARKAS